MSGPRELDAGDATFSKAFNKTSRGENGEQLTVGFKAPKGREFVTMLLGDVEAGQAWVDVGVMLNNLGFYRDDILHIENQRLEAEVARLREVLDVIATCTPDDKARDVAMGVLLTSSAALPTTANGEQLASASEGE